MFFGGGGIRFKKSNEYKSVESLFNQVTKSNELIEELIIQHPEMSKLSPTSINTIRLYTLYGEPFAAVLRMGNGLNKVDNGDSGGLFAGIDINSGMVCSDLYNLKCQSWEKHPVTDVYVKGLELPFWNSCLSLAKEAYKLISGIPFVGWDWAITNNGPELVEANARPEINIMQVSHNMGKKNQFFQESIDYSRNKI